VSPDGKNVYVGSYKNTSEEGFAVFSRDPMTGALTQLPGPAGCLTADGASAAGPGTCTKVRGFGIGDGHDLVFTSDGLWAYGVNQQANPTDPAGSVLIFQRDPSTGALTQLPGSAGCVSAGGASQDGPATCQTAPQITRPFGIAISPDDRYLYVSAFGNSQHIVVLSRDTTTGALTEVQCLSQAPVPLTCGTTGRALGQDQQLVISPDGRHAYSSSGYTGGGISVFDRDPATGVLTQKPGMSGCISDTGADDTGAATCAVGRVLGSPYGLTISPDGHTLYVPAEFDNGLAVFHVSADGSLSQLAGTAGCTTSNGMDNLGNATCAVGRGLVEPFGAAISPDGRTLYEAADNNRLTDGIASFALDPSGVVTQLTGLAGCTTVDGSSGSSAGACGVGGNTIKGAYTPGISPDGASVYVPGYDGQALVEYRREVGPITTAPTTTTTVASPPPVVPGRHVGSGAIRPVLSHVRQAHARWREAGAPGRAPTGTAFAFTLNETARVSLTFVQRGGGRRIRGRCVAQTANNRHHRSCDVPRGTLVAAAHRGRNTLAFAGRVGRRLLGPGRYAVRIVATSGGRTSSAQNLAFAIV
jgi:DNA-binding beta-propeller fold protein YncE